MGKRLSAVGQWDSMPMVRRLRAIHVAAAFAMLDLTMLIATGARGPSGTTIALLTVAVAVLVGCLALLCAPALLDTTEARVTDQVTSALQATACGLTVVTVAAVLLDRTPWPRADGLPGYDETVASVFLSQTALLAALGLLTLSQRGRERQGGLLRGMGAPVIAAVAAGLGVAFSANLVYRTAYFLNRHALTSAPEIWRPRRWPTSGRSSASSWR